MWEDRDPRKYSVPQSMNYVGSAIGVNSMFNNSNVNSGPSGVTGGYSNRGYDQTEDLHAWSIYRQNLNADLSESAIGLNKSNNNNNSERPFGNFQLKETTVNNILNHPKYGPRLKNHDPYTYLRFGLPRVKASQSEFGEQQFINEQQNHNQKFNNNNNQNQNQNQNRRNKVINKNSKTNNNRQTGYGQGMTSDSASASDDEFEPNHNNRRKQVRRTWKSDPDLLKTNTDSAFIEKNPFPISKQNKRNGHTGNSSLINAGKTMSEIDLKYSSNAFGGETFGFNGKPYGGMVNMNSGGSTLGLNGVNMKGTHLIVRNLYYELDKTSNSRKFCGARRQKLRVLDNISFEVRGGETLALMTTNEMEGTSILNILSNQHNKFGTKLKGDLILNGVYMTPEKLSSYVAYVGQSAQLCPQMSTRQTLLFSTLLKKPSRKNDFDTKKRINAILEELSLSDVRHTCVADLTESEKRRLMIAIAVLQDTDILIMDQPSKGMDIFDSFFLIEYIRQWSILGQRSIILTIHPATYEIFTMLTRIALISTGRLIYFGKRKDLLSYFSYIDFPCPAYKNPSDYYLDLVTLDTLSQEAILESSQRIENLVEVYSRRYANSISTPRPLNKLPASVKTASFPLQFLALWIRALIFTFPYNIIHLFRNIFIALCLSIVTGAIYWHVRGGREQENLWDRIGLFHVLLTVLPMPLFLIEIHDLIKEKQYVHNETKIGLYSKPAYIISKLIYTFPHATITYLAFSLPISSMAGLHQNLLLYLLTVICYLHCLRMIAIFSACLFNHRSSSTVCFALICSLFILASGTSFHNKDLSMFTRWLYQISPTRWSHEPLIAWEFSSNGSIGPNSLFFSTSSSSSSQSNVNYLCTHNPIIQQENAILIKADCGLQTQGNILKWFTFKGGNGNQDEIRPISNTFIALAICYTAFLLCSFFVFCLFSKKKKDKIKYE